MKGDAVAFAHRTAVSEIEAGRAARRRCVDVLSVSDDRHGVVAREAAKWNIGDAVALEAAAELWARALSGAEGRMKDGERPVAAWAAALQEVGARVDHRLLRGAFAPASTCMWSNAVLVEEGRGYVAFRERAATVVALLKDASGGAS